MRLLSWRAGRTYPFSATYGYEPNGDVAFVDTYNGRGASPATRLTYQASYDALDRLTGAVYQSAPSAAAFASAGRFTGGGPAQSVLGVPYSLSGITYDRNGNLLTLVRNGASGGTLDNLTYAYVTGKNQLAAVTDASGSSSEDYDAESGAFTYDANGNVLTAPQPYGISAVTYDHRNLPTYVTVPNSLGDVILTYRYNADGQRYFSHAGFPRAAQASAQAVPAPTSAFAARQASSTALTTARPQGALQGSPQGGSFPGGVSTESSQGRQAILEYYALDGTVTVAVSDAATGSVLHFNVLAPSGEVLGRYGTAAGGSAFAGKAYYHQDLLGSTRAVVSSTGTVRDGRDYDPWGLELPAPGGAGTSDLHAAREGYTGKERDSETHLDYFGARFYMAALGRWTSPDPLAGRPFEEHPGVSPYAYVLDNPLALVDPDGRQEIAAFRFYEQQNRALLSGEKDRRTVLAENGAYREASIALADELGRVAFEPYDYFRTGVDLYRGNLSGVEAGATVAGAALPFVSGSIGRNVLRSADDLAVGGFARSGAFEFAEKVSRQLDEPRLGNLAGKLSLDDVSRLANNPSAQRFFDARTGNINVVQEVDGVLLRITTPRDANKIISVGRLRPNQLRNRIADGDFVEILPID